jgi:hypothetical protein
MRSVRIRLQAGEFSATMRAMSEWLDANRYVPARYKYDHNEDAVLVTVDFTEDAAAEAFAIRFDGTYYSSRKPISPDSGRRSAVHDP